MVSASQHYSVAISCMDTPNMAMYTYSIPHSCGFNEFFCSHGNFGLVYAGNKFNPKFDLIVDHHTQITHS